MRAGLTCQRFLAEVAICHDRTLGLSFQTTPFGIPSAGRADIRLADTPSTAHRHRDLCPGVRPETR
jgi:hypothetical protein